MLDRLINALAESPNEAADDLLLEAMALGNGPERMVALAGLIRRKRVRGLLGVIGQFESLPEEGKNLVLRNMGTLHLALGECGRSQSTGVRLMAMKLIALGREGKLAYVLEENLRDPDGVVSKAAAEALVALARWVATETRKLQRGIYQEAEKQGAERKWSLEVTSQEEEGLDQGEREALGAVEGILGTAEQGRNLADNESMQDEGRRVYAQLMELRPEIEKAVARAMDQYRGPFVQDVLRAALLLSDRQGSRTFEILQMMRHGGQSLMVRRLQQAPDSEHVEAFLLAASHGGLKTHFGTIFAHITQRPVLDAILRKTHWLKDEQLQACMRQVTRGLWWEDGELLRDLERRKPGEAAKIGDWIVASGMGDGAQDVRLERLLSYAREDAGARLRLLRLVMERGQGGSIRLLKLMLNDPDERIMRMAVREIVRRKPAGIGAILLPLMISAPATVRKLVARAVGNEGFEHFWNSYDQLDKGTRKQAGRAMLKILPDAAQRLGRRMQTGEMESRLKALQMAHDLNLAEGMRDELVKVCGDANPKLRSRAVSVLGESKTVPMEVVLEKALNDVDARVRANAIEVLDTRGHARYLPLLAERARTATNNRERANAIKALHRMKVGAASEQLGSMLRDPRPEHRVSAMWALRQIGWWQLLRDVGQLAKTDDDLNVRRYALGVLRSVAAMAQVDGEREVG